MGANIIRWLIGLASIAIVYGLINFIFIGGQNLMHRDEQQRLDALNAELEVQLVEIQKQENELVSFKKEIDEIEFKMNQLEDRIDMVESEYPNGIPEQYFDDYNIIFSEYDRLYASYERQVYSYNAKIEEAKLLAEEIGSTWYIAPIRIRGN